MQSLITVGVVLALGIFVMVAWRKRTRRLTHLDPEARCRRDIQAMRRRSTNRTTGRDSSDVWAAGETAPEHSRGKQAVAWIAVASVSGGCGGCGGCGCGG